MYPLIRIVSVLLCLLLATHSWAEQALLQRKDVQQFINDMVNKHHFKRQEVVNVLKEAHYQPKIIESMQRPYEKKNWDVYKELFLTPVRLQKGIEFWQSHRESLKKAEEKYGVPAHIIVAIIGVETLYGQRQGNYKVLDALTTLAFHYPKRAKFFKKELKEYLLLCRELNTSPTTFYGSYAGAMGKPQFMPSSYRYYAVDFSGNGKRDLMDNDDDVIGSVANYFHKHGWKKNEDVAEPLDVKSNNLKPFKTNTRVANYDYQRLVKAGVTPATSSLNRPKKAGLIELNTKYGQEYWMAYPNFYVITRYNTSPQYALVVYLLSEQLQNHWAAVYKTITNAYA